MGVEESLVCDWERRWWFSVAYRESAKFYDLFAKGKEKELEFYLQRAREAGSPVLELGVGTGLFAIALAGEGFEVVGIDNSPYILRLARNKLRWLPRSTIDKLTFLQGDMASFQLNRTFRLIYIPSETFQYMDTRAKQGSCLRCVRDHLHPEGRFVFDVWVGKVDSSGVWRRLETEQLPDGSAVTRSISSRVFEEGGVIDIGLRFDVHNRYGRLKETLYDWSRLAILTVDQVKRLLSDAGFEVVAVYSSFSCKPWSSRDNRAIFDAKLVKV